MADLKSCGNLSNNSSQSTQPYNNDSNPDDWLDEGYFDRMVAKQAAATALGDLATAATTASTAATSATAATSEATAATGGTAASATPGSASATSPNSAPETVRLVNGTTSRTTDTKVTSELSATDPATVTTDYELKKPPQPDVVNENHSVSRERSAVNGDHMQLAGEKRKNEKDEESGTISLSDAGSPAKRVRLMRDKTAWQEAMSIAEMLNVADQGPNSDVVEAIYDEVSSQPAVPNRVDILLERLLQESGLEKLVDDWRGRRKGQGERRRDSANDIVEAVASETEQIDDLLADIDKVKVIVRATHPTATFDENNIFLLLEAISGNANRVREVADRLIQCLSSGSGEGSSTVWAAGDNGVVTINDDGDVDGKMLEDINAVMRTFPNVDPNEVYQMLEARRATGGGATASTSKVDDSAVRDVVQQLEERKKRLNETGVITLDDGDGSGTTDVAPLVNDMNLIAAVFPDADRNEIYAYLEAHHAKPNRVQIVTDELLRIANGDAASQGASLGAVADHVDITDDASAAGGTGKAPMARPAAAGYAGDENGFAATDVYASPQMEAMLSIFPDCDPNYIYERLEEVASVENGYDTLMGEMFERRYPKLQDRLAAEQLKATRNRLMNVAMPVIDEFLEMFPDPETAFYPAPPVAPVAPLYKEHARTQLRNDYRMLCLPSVDRVFLVHEYRYAPSVRYIEANMHTAVKPTRQPVPIPATGIKLIRLRNERVLQKLPDELCEPFYRELQYVRNRDRVLRHIADKKMERERRMAHARIRNELQTCGCCYDDEVLFEDMLACPDGHLFCQECIRRSVEVAVGEGKGQFNCLFDGCTAEFSTETLRKVLSSKTFSLCLRKMQEEAIRLADIQDLVSCPFCSFSTIMPNPDDKVFRCLNPECLKESCRLCKEPNHVPLRCNEIEQSAEKSMRTFIEARMSEAMIRTCWQCGKRFYKTEGCNKMTCTCGAFMCYVCRQPIKDYSHFNNGRCGQESNIEELHVKEMKAAAEEAKREYLASHPEAASTELKHDPLKLIEKAEEARRQGGNWFGAGMRYGNDNANDVANEALRLLQQQLNGHNLLPFGIAADDLPNFQILTLGERGQLHVNGQQVRFNADGVGLPGQTPFGGIQGGGVPGRLGDINQLFGGAYYGQQDYNDNDHIDSDEDLEEDDYDDDDSNDFNDDLSTSGDGSGDSDESEGDDDDDDEARDDDADEVDDDDDASEVDDDDDNANRDENEGDDDEEVNEDDLNVIMLAAVAADFTDSD